LLKHVLVILFIAVPSFGQQIITLPLNAVALANELPDAPANHAAQIQNDWHTGTKNLAQLAANSAGNEAASDFTSLDGTRAKLMVDSEITSKLPSGSAFQVKLTASISIHGQVLLPQGTIFQGRVETRRARRLMRPGSLFMTFERVVLPAGETQPVNLHLVSSESPAIKTDEEGRIHPALSKKRLAIQLGGTALSAKIADDLAEEAGGAAVGAGTARFFGMGAAATFFALQKGREVTLKPGDKLEIEFGRPGTSMPRASAHAEDGLGLNR
jgi:hypothetical protein